MSQAVLQSQYHDGYDTALTGNAFANGSALTSSPQSSRRTARESESGHSPPPHTPQQRAAYMDGTMYGTSQETPRAHAAPAPFAPDGMTNSTYEQYYPNQASLPYRTTGAQQTTSATAGTHSPQYNTRTQPSSGYGSESDRVGTSDDERRRQQQRSPRETQPQQPTSGRSQRTRQAPVTSRSQNAIGQPPVDTSLPRENSTVINRIVVDDPGTDISRERQRVAEARPQHGGDGSAAMMSNVNHSAAEVTPVPQQRSRQEHLKHHSGTPGRKEVKFGEYILGSTLGEGEFGKVKMGWKKDSPVQVAIKLIRKDTLAGNATRLPKIYREINILKELQHPNIVRLHEFIETERHMGIVLEYASGGELFDYILKHRYLKDPAARRLFAQLVSGVGYLHKKGIVHRDLKLENLLLDRNKNIIITDFGFANTFDAHDELGEATEKKIHDREYIRSKGLDRQDPQTNHRRGDLMQTSCGSPCYAAPELVVSDGLYTGRKVDVWSCGVILYAMLAGYLPFDDDPANPEGDNINLLYKYIVSTPLTFPEYVSPHARDLLRRILVPDPRQRADLFEVARHSWLSEYTHVLGFIGSSAKSDIDIAKSAEMQGGIDQQLGRSASVREPASRSPAVLAPGGVQKQAANVGEEMDGRNKRDAKRRTVQVEYVAPPVNNSRTDNGGYAQSPVPSSATNGKTRARGDSQGPVEVTPTPARDSPAAKWEQPLSSTMPPPNRPTREQARAVSESVPYIGQGGHASRPSTGGRLPSRGNSYGLPVVAAATTETAQGRFSQPKPSTGGYIISSPISSEHGTNDSRNDLNQYQQQQYPNIQQPQQRLPPSHKRSSTLGSLGDRLLGRSSSKRSSKDGVLSKAQNEKRDRRYPPVSMNNAIQPNTDAEATPRPSTESKRRPSFSFSRKNSDAPPTERRNSRRFSFLPGSFSMNNFGGKKEQGYESEQSAMRRDSMQRGEQSESNGGMAFGRGQSRSPSADTTNSTIPLHYEPDREAARQNRRSAMTQGAPQTRYEKALPPQPVQQANLSPPVQRKQFRDDGFGGNSIERNASQQQEPVERFYTPSEEPANGAAPGRPGPYNSGVGGSGRAQPDVNYMEPDFPTDDGYGANQTPGLTAGQNQMRPNQRKFDDGYEQGHGGSSSGARRVMDFFRRRGKERAQA
ncbi:hypothetical protein LTR62_003051 [Meristemomyces frigidus]|uniref:non-specific serine/threonine protein kinase n=1 Tax=Meristemomyces frigidus TaxID=1508187 RepID=A0AAN7TJU0_9PEZI|nr:hypothetical protein LTR62_003051 [Meristemomyces frigidus]